MPSDDGLEGAIPRSRGRVKKEWAAIDDEGEIVLTANTHIGVETALRRRGEDPDEYEILAVPKVNGGWVKI